MKKEKGITLIALIITIIVMLILVGVTVRVALNGGLFETTKKAVRDTQYEADREILQGAIIGALDRDLVISDEEALKKNLPENWNVAKEGTIYKVTSPNENEYKVNKDGEINEPITSKADWWEFQGDEAEEVKATSVLDFGYDIALSDDGTKAVVRGKNDSSNIDALFVVGGGYVYMNILNDKTLNQMGNNTLEIYKWYKCKNLQLIDPIEYTGNCPIAISDFTDDEIYSRSYLERVIENFNK